MRNVFLASRWMAVGLAISLCAVAGDTRGNEPQSRQKGGGSGGAKSSSGGGDKISGGKKPDAGAKSGARVKPDARAKPHAGATSEAAKPRAAEKPGTRVKSEAPAKPHAVVKPEAAARPDAGAKAAAGVGDSFNKKAPSKASWKSWTKDGWNKDGWNSKLNSQHQRHRHGYWNNGIWISPYVITSNRPWIYLQPPRPIVSGRKWLGVTHEPYDGGGAYVTGIYEDSPAQAVGLEVGDVIVSLDGVDATDLGKVIQASDGDVLLQALSGRTGELVQAQVNLTR